MYPSWAKLEIMKLQISRLNSQAHLLPPSHGGALSSLLWCWLPFYHPPPLRPITSTSVTAEVRAECPYSVFASKPWVPNPSCSVPVAPRHTNPHFDFVRDSPAKAEKVLSGLDPASASGPDDIGGHVLKSYKSSVASFLSALFSLSFSFGTFPSALRSANVTPIYKKGIKTDPTNDRPVSLFTIASKVMESIIIAVVQSILLSNNLISNHQFGFRPGPSTPDMLLLPSEQYVEVPNLLFRPFFWTFLGHLMQSVILHCLHSSLALVSEAAFLPGLLTFM